jgi:histidinol-phosphate/aromatic aminotransferase/cobyric acid decarboxylase-like protein
VNAETLYGRLKARNILIRYFPGPRTGDFVRITVGTDSEADSLLEAIRASSGKVDPG